MSSDNELHNKKKTRGVGGNGADLPDNRGKTYRRRKTDDVRPALFKSYYTDPKSDTFLNVYQSALRSGYREHYASSLSSKNNRPKWFEELMEESSVRRARMLGQAEKGLEEAMSYDSSDTGKAALKLKASSFIAERLGKEHYSTRQEVTGADGRKLFGDKERNSASVPLAELFKAGNDGS